MLLTVLATPTLRTIARHHAIKMSTAASTVTITERERFLFDLNGFLVVRNVFSAEEIAAANVAVDAHQSTMKPRQDALRNAKAGTPMSADGPRNDMGGMLWWPEEQSQVFRDVLTHPKLVPYYTALCGEGYRMDHQPILIAQEADSEGFSLHGGPIASGGPNGRFNPELQYRCVNGQPWTSLLAASLQLVDHNEGDGGFCVVRGSHKLNLPVPADLANGMGEDFAEHVHHPVTKAGDVVIWSEATVHGATPWRASRQRRICIYRFAPPNMGYGRGYLDMPPGALDHFTELQRAVVEPPYAVRLERPLVTPQAAAAGEPASKRPRDEAKKDHDRATLGTAYF